MADEVPDVEVAPLVVLPVVAVFEALAAGGAAEGSVLAVGAQVGVQAALGLEAGAAQVARVVPLVRVDGAVRGQVPRADDLTADVTRGRLLVGVAPVLDEVIDVLELCTARPALLQLATLQHMSLQHAALGARVLLPTLGAHLGRVSQLVVPLLFVREEHLGANGALEPLDLGVFGNEVISRLGRPGVGVGADDAVEARRAAVDALRVHDAHLVTQGGRVGRLATPLPTATGLSAADRDGATSAARQCSLRNGRDPVYALSAGNYAWTGKNENMPVEHGLTALPPYTVTHS